MGQKFTFYGPFNCVIDEITGALSRHGHHVVRSFDLQSARAHYDNEECPCPHHGTSACTCQYVVLLAYAPARAGHHASPCVVTAHSFELATQVAFHRSDARAGDDCSGALAALMEAAESLRSKEQPAQGEQAEMSGVLMYC